jgi:ribonuclease BN (tRNA processing enzyme)
VLGRLAALFPVTTAPVLDRSFDLAFDVREYRPGTRFAVGGMTVSLHELRHSAPNCGIRIESADGCVAYTGDTGVAPGLLPLAADADLFLAEATLTATDQGPHGHLSAADAAREFDGVIHLARPGATFEIGRGHLRASGNPGP